MTYRENDGPHHGGAHHQGGHHQGGGYQQGGPPPPSYGGQGEAASYYAGAQQQQHSPQGQQGYGQQAYGQPQHHQQPQQYGDSPNARDNYNSNYNDNNNNNNGSPGQDGPEGERGLLGALGGGIAGAVGGNKIGGKATGHSKTSTVIGALAGAFAGHKIQDGVSDWKDDRKEEKAKKEQEEADKKRREEDEKRRKREEEEAKKKKNEHSPIHHNGPNVHKRPPSPKHHDKSQRSPTTDRNIHYAGGFSGSARDIRLDAHGEYLLHASCQRLDGSWQSSTLSLNKHITNDNGSFHWGSPSHNNNNSQQNSGGGGLQTVTVQPGDTLRNIAARFPGANFEEIARHNGVQNADMIYPGQVLQIPGTSTASHSNNNNNSSGSKLSDSARNVRLTDGGRRLEGELRRGGDWVASSITLDERVGNSNGTLTFVN